MTIIHLPSLIKRFVDGDQSALAQAITLVESTHPEHHDLGLKFLAAIRHPTTPALRVAISGPPGVGKSTFINALGQEIVKAHLKLAVLAIDPTSEESLGSLLGDKTRMADLLSLPGVYIRPSPSQSFLGGVSPKTRDVLFLVESFGFDVVLMETVGVGQSESLAQSLCDYYVMLVQPGAGDDLQAMKRGNTELADFLLVNKADGELMNLARQTLSTIQGAHRAADHCMLVSSHTKTGINTFWQTLQQVHTLALSSGELFAKRQKRGEKFFAEVVKNALLEKLKANPAFLDLWQKQNQRLGRDELTITQALNELMAQVQVGVKSE
jgi:LAO/AO transport system kinase